MKRLPIQSVMFTLVFMGLLLVNGCSQENDKAPTISAPPNEKIIKGVSLSPKSFQQTDFINFFEKAEQTGGIVSWAGDWNELSNTQTGGPTVIASLATNYHYTPLIEVQFFTQSTGQLLRQLDKSTKQGYKNYVLAFAEKYKPKYLGLGIEINALYEKSPSNFENFASFFSEVYDEIKIKSPDTKIFTIFQLEKMKGLNGGLFGGINNQSKTQWQLLERFSKSDITVFTTYPGLIYKHPSEIPSEYYTEIKSHTTKPIAFTEIGWHITSDPIGWESSDQEQAEFITTFFDRTKDLNTKFVIWSFMYDQNTIEPFKSMGLRNDDDTARSAWDRWVTTK